MSKRMIPSRPLTGRDNGKKKPETKQEFEQEKKMWLVLWQNSWGNAPSCRGIPSSIIMWRLHGSRGQAS